MTEHYKLTATASLRAIANGQISAIDRTNACLQRIAGREPQVLAFRDIDPDGAREQALHSSGEGLLRGVPVAVKECFDVRDRLCCRGTPIHRQRRATADAELVRRLRAQGAVIVGTTLCTEYTIARAAATTNPHDANRTPGGSSSGSAAAVAAGMVPLALGTQAVGSVVRPALYCGIYGFKPGRGELSLDGCMPLAQSLDHGGYFARSLDDLALFGRALRDYSAADPGVDAKHQFNATEITVLVIDGPLSARVQSPTQAAMARARRAFEGAGATVIERKLDSLFDTHYRCLETILAVECARNHGLDRDRHGEQMSDKMRSIIDQGRAVSEANYIDAKAQAEAMRESLLAMLDQRTVILSPATDGIAPHHQVDGTGSNHLQALWTLCGLPVLAAPMGSDQAMPVGVQLIAGEFAGQLLLSAAALLGQQVIEPV